MTDTLFDLPDSPSPRLEWMRRYDIYADEMPETWKGYRWVCGNVCSPLRFGYGDTKDEALTDFAIKNNLKLWNEE